MLNQKLKSSVNYLLFGTFVNVMFNFHKIFLFVTLGLFLPSCVFVPVLPVLRLPLGLLPISHLGAADDSGL